MGFCSQPPGAIAMMGVGLQLRHDNHGKGIGAGQRFQFRPARPPLPQMYHRAAELHAATLESRTALELQPVVQLRTAGRCSTCLQRKRRV